MNDPNLDDITKTTFCIPYTPQGNKDPQPVLMPKSYYEHQDLHSGRELRLEAYRSAWNKCLRRMQEIVRELQDTSVKDVVKEVRESYLNILPGLPYPELPVISLINSSLGSNLLDSITSALEHGDQNYSGEGARCIVIHLYPGDVPTIAAGMRAIISAFVDKDQILETVKNKPISSLANYDIKYLVAWYRSWVGSQGVKPNLIVILHAFEQFDPVVMQDIFYICSGQISELPLVFLLSMTSPLTNYLNITYPRATLSLLRIRNFSAPSGENILQEILLGTFFDTKFQPDIMIGPTTLECLQDYFGRYHPSVDAIFTIIQLAHLRHFSTDPLTALVNDTPSIKVLSNADASAFLEFLQDRIQASEGHSEDIDMDDSSPSSTINAVNTSRNGFRRRMINMKLGFQLMILLQSFLEEQGYRGLNWSPDLAKRGGLCTTMLQLLEGHLGKDVKQLGMMARKLKREELMIVLSRIYQFLQNLPISISSAEQPAKLHNTNMRMELNRNPDSEDVFVTASEDFGDWIVSYISEKIQPLEKCALWEIWYTGLSPFPAELINPSIRASLLAGLLRPHEFAADISAKLGQGSDLGTIRDLPDTSILFKRYLDSSKMINVYDWFESFKSVLDDQRQQHLKERALPQTPKKSGKGKGKAKAPPQPQIESSVEEDEGKWNAQVQARFIRALHELDHLGFIKHSGRKADHLMRTVFDIDDAE